MRSIQAIALLSLLATGFLPSSTRADETNKVLRANGLFSDDEQTVLEYLRDHRIPNSTGQPSGPALDAPRYLREVERAVELFKTGSHAVRLAIAKALPAYSNDGMKFWPLCGKEDYEAKHYLFGLALAASKPEQRDELRDWLVNESHPSYATALLKNLKYFYFRQFFEDATKAEEDELLAFLKDLYHQKGHVVVKRSLPGDYLREELGGPVQKYVVQLLPRTPAGAKVLLDWISRDSKKVDEATLEAMWNKWNPSELEDMEDISSRRDVAESFLLSEQWGKRRLLDQPAFDKNVCRQIFNPDDRVRMEALRFVISLGGVVYHHTHVDQAACFGAIREASATKAMRSSVLREAREMFQELLKSKKKKGYREEVLQGDFTKLADAIASKPETR
jgi:hypothetical protein